MGYFRFHRSMKVLPGVRLNLSRSGPSVSLGVRGARFNVGPRGTRTTVGILGTGLSYVDQRAWKSMASTDDAPPLAPVGANVARPLRTFRAALLALAATALVLIWIVAVFG